VYSVSHDLRAPLLAIQGLIRLIHVNGDKFSEEAESYLDMMMASANRMDETIKEILEYSRNARLEVAIEPIDFKQMINEIFTDVKHIFPKSLRLEVNTNEKEVFYSDPYRIKTMLKNLIGNAVKYQRSDTDHPYLKIHITTDKDKALLRFEDNGEGIAPEYIDKIFDMFFRASNTTVGTGLGLYICREIAHNLGGTIAAESRPGKGSVFTVEIKNLKN
jgi:signal transduction histidine kinase